MKAQLFTVPPNMGAFFTVIIGTFVSDKIRARGPIMIVGCSVAIVGYIMLLVPARPLVHYGGTFLVAAGKSRVVFWRIRTIRDSDTLRRHLSELTSRDGMVRSSHPP